MAVRTEHSQIVDATFTTTLLVPVKNEVRGSTLIAILNVVSFTGGVAPSIALRLFNLDKQGARVPATKINGSPGNIIVPGTQTLVWGPGGAADSLADDGNSGALPRNVEIEVNPDNGDQTSANITLDVILA